MATRKVSFYRLSVLADGAVSRVHDVNWVARLTEYFASSPMEDRKFTTQVGDDLVAWSTAMPAQAVLGRVLDGSPGISSGNWHDVAATPITPESEDDFFSRTTYLQFLPRSNVVALVGGASGRPSKGNVDAFIDRIAPLDSGRHWQIEPITQESQLVRFKTMKGATRASIKTTVEPAPLPGPDDGTQQSLDQLIQSISDNLGAGIKVDLKISIQKPSDNHVAGKVLKDAILRSPHLLGGAKKVSVKAYDGMKDEIVELIEHDMAASIDMPDADVDGKITEAFVLAGLSEACERNESAVCNAARLGH